MHAIRRLTRRHEMPEAEERAATANALAFHTSYTKQAVWTALWRYVRLTSRRRRQYKELADRMCTVMVGMVVVVVMMCYRWPSRVIVVSMISECRTFL